MIQTIGFTGSRHGMTNDQQISLHRLFMQFSEAGAKKVRHGVCVGSDAEFHAMATRERYYTIGHPGVDQDGLPKYRAILHCDEMLLERPFLERNKYIVSLSEVLMATPAEKIEQVRSGTWSTIRQAKKWRKALIVILPDGSLDTGYANSCSAEYLQFILSTRGEAWRSAP